MIFILDVLILETESPLFLFKKKISFVLLEVIVGSAVAWAEKLPLLPGAGALKYSKLLPAAAYENRMILP